MNSASINFLEERVRVQEGLLVRDRKLAYVTSIALGVFLFVVFGVFAYSTYLVSQKNSIDREIAEAQEQLQALSTIEKKHQMRTATLSIIEAIFDKRGKDWDAIAYIYSLLPSGAYINGVSVSKTEGTVSCTVHSENVFVHNQVVEALQSSTIKDDGYQLRMGNLTRGRDGSYDLNVELGIADTVKSEETESQ